MQRSFRAFYGTMRETVVKAYPHRCNIWVAFPITQEKEMCRPRERIRKRWFFFIVGVFS